MFSLIYRDLRVLKKQNFGFGKNNQELGSRRLGFGSNFFIDGLKKFKFVKSKKIDLIFLNRFNRLLKDDIFRLSSFFNLNLQKKILKRIDFLKFNRSWRGVRHLNGLPVRGQRTKTNARTRKVRRVKK